VKEMLPGVLMQSTIQAQTYANVANTAVMRNELNRKIVLASFAAATEIPPTISKLNEAEPIKVIGPNELGGLSISENVLKKQRKISGAADPNARRVT